MRSVFDDPPAGKTITELSDLQRTTPNPSLFKIPCEYEMRIESFPTPAPSPIDEIMKSIKPILPAPPSK
ncbi:MAG: hypothetical protein ABSF59_14840 [Candidatus Sulfotelmatobacter sp.]